MDEEGKTESEDVTNEIENEREGEDDTNTTTTTTTTTSSTTLGKFETEVTGGNDTNIYIGRKNRRGIYLTSVTIPTFVG